MGDLIQTCSLKWKIQQELSLCHNNSADDAALLPGIWDCLYYNLSQTSFPAGVVRASSIFPILSAILLLLGGFCVAASRVYKSKRNIILGAGILFVAAGM